MTKQRIRMSLPEADLLLTNRTVRRPYPKSQGPLCALVIDVNRAANQFESRPNMQQGCGSTMSKYGGCLVGPRPPRVKTRSLILFERWNVRESGSSPRNSSAAHPLLVTFF